MRRRDLLHFGIGAAAALALPGAAWATGAVRRVRLLNLHTGERGDIVFAEGGRLMPDALAAINTLLRDHRTGEVHEIDTNLLTLVADLADRISAAQPFEVISGYRSPVTNAALHAASAGVATRSLHMQGRAIDIRAPGLASTALRDAALGLGRGGVGYYPGPDFVHVDVGRVRAW